ncbi:MAG: hypothetical protein AWU54_1717 [Candidatus Frackibacter sp. T328-2]|nr:MAG: hypothetical protein AWU54_1717 [Candidatus Frackibacter sp. T328-2]
MSRDLSTDVQNEKDKSYNRPIELYQVFLDQQTLYLARYQKDIQFFDENGNPQTYTAANLDRGSISTNADTKVDEVSVTIGNVNKEMSAYIANTKFQGRRLVIWKVFLDHLDSANNKIIMFDGIMDAPKVNQEVMTVDVVSRLDTLDKDLPSRFYGVKCSWQFGGPDTCGVSVPTKIGTVEYISADHLTINDSDITEASNYWKYGEITIGSESRHIVESGSGYVKVEYPFSADITAGDSYDMKAGCDKSYDGGHGCAFWSNTQYYGGFLSIPKIRNVRKFG